MIRQNFSDKQKCVWFEWEKLREENLQGMKQAQCSRLPAEKLHCNEETSHLNQDLIHGNPRYENELYVAIVG